MHSHVTSPNSLGVRDRGVHTNKSFVLNLLNHTDFIHVSPGLISSSIN